MVDINIKGIDEKEINLINKAAKLMKRSRSNFMLTSSIDAAKKIIYLLESKK